MQLSTAAQSDPYPQVPSQHPVLHHSVWVCGCGLVLGGAASLELRVGDSGLAWLLLHRHAAVQAAVPEVVGGGHSHGPPLLLRHLHGLHHTLLHQCECKSQCPERNVLIYVCDENFLFL